MSAVCLDPLIQFCSRRRARKLIRAERRHAIAAIPWPHRTPILNWLLVSRTPFTRELHAALLVATEIYPAAHWRSWEFRHFAQAVDRGVTLETLETWAWLRADAGVDVSLFGVRGPQFRFPLELTPSRLETGDWSVQYMLEQAWRLCAEAPQFADLLTDPLFLALSARVQYWFLSLCLEPGANPAPLLAGIQPGSEDVPAVFLSKVSTSAALALLAQYPKLRPVEQSGLHLAAELAERHSARVAERIAAFPPAVLVRIAKAPRNRQLWYECREALVHLDEPLLVDALANRPDLLFALGERLHAFGRVRARRLLLALGSHPLLGPVRPLTEGPDALVELDRLLTAHRGLAGTVPAFATWDRHFSGEKPLGRRAIEDVGAQVLEGLIAIRIRYVLQRVDEEIALFGDAHAGLLRAGLTKGRHPLLRFLRAHAAGRDPRSSHPANRRWLTERPDFPLETWLHPLRITLPVSGLGEVTLAVETDPFELLRVGTYARSCLAAGGCNSANAVAVLLDINKRAIFARSANGRFLARQIVAVSDCGKLVAHAVYPETSTKLLGDFFQLFVEDWAMQMRLPMARGRGHTVSALAVPTWYDDGVWDRYWAVKD